MTIQNLGKIEVAVGPMFSGKSEWLVSKLRVHQIAQNKVLAVKPSIDDRYNQTHITSHNSTKYAAKSIKSTSELKELIENNKGIEILGIDEVQFFDPSIVVYLVKLEKEGIIVYATGLDLDFAGVPWETTQRLLCFSQKVEKLFSVCTICYQLNGTRTQRLINGEPAAKNSPKVLIGGTDSYTARCLLHHEVLE